MGDSRGFGGICGKALGNRVFDGTKWVRWGERGRNGERTISVPFTIWPEAYRGALARFSYPAYTAYVCALTHDVTSIVLYMSMDTIGGNYISVL
jgi:hypothetical protein